MTDEDRAADRKRLLAELLAEADANAIRARAAKQKLTSASSPVVEERRGGRLTNLFGTVILTAGLLAVSFVLMATAMTIMRYTGNDFADARRTGTATVEECERRGPIGLEGFGYYDRCTVRIVWQGQTPMSEWDYRFLDRRVISEPGFFKGEKPGDTFQIGEEIGRHLNKHYSRPDYPSHGWVTAIGVVVWIIGFLPLFAVLFVMYVLVKELPSQVKGLFRRFTGLFRRRA